MQRVWTNSLVQVRRLMRSGESVMSESSWFFKSAWASTYFRRTLEGQVFICLSPWIFGRSREYQLSDAQAEELVRRIGRAYVKGIYIIGVGLVLVSR